MDIIILVVVAAVSAGFAVRIIKNGLKSTPKLASMEESVPVKVFPKPVRAEQMARGLQVNFPFNRNTYGGWVKSFRGRRVVIASVMRGRVRLVHRRVHQITM